ncbi:SWR1 complex subunit 2 isoform X2 [Arachis ipaensis]|uniref:SWR1 complex subunit 2 isoform X2 n=1 Tax=Arachis ipaensis TaxID=130454 RepID=UPI0007AF287A|nr:SWR1 complex subunit 2 isoform X2 [Arachis ipaensis]QHO60165.1 SWR1 complex subunit [Arachis hypogaea]QHO60166.1 SWR1 complex subunit [Arachis hypogaea]
MESSEPAPPVVLLDRASRATRGKRMTKLLDDEIQQDDLFWNQDALKDEEEDDNYVEEAEVADEFDSDFNDEESEPDDQPDNDIADERVHKKKRLIFPGKKLPKPKKSKKKQKVLSKLERSPNDDDDDDDEDNDDDDDDKPEKEPVPEEHHDTRDDGGEKIIRKSTRTAVIVRQAERDAIRALQASMKPQTVKKKKEGEEKRMTQEEMLLEAAQTEIMNLRNLERVLAREEEVKRKAIVHKTVYNGPQIRYISKDGYTYLEFIKGSSFHSDIATTPVQYPEQPLCAITGLPAKYRDPKTGLPYATKEAFKEIRQRFAEENANNRKQMAMGILYDSVSGCGFSLKQKRSMVPDKSVHTNFRPYARFRRMPASEDEDSD